MRLEIKSQTGLRGLAALVVAISHLDLAQWLPAFHHDTQWLWRSWAAVDVFFLLSGFILAYTYVQPWQNPPPLKWSDFFRQRFARIYPLFFLTTLLMALWPFLLTSPENRDLSQHTFRHAASELTLTHALPIVGVKDAWNYPSWSISIEFFCYLFLFPVWYASTRFLARAGSAVVATLAIVLLGAEMFYLCKIHDPAISPIFGWTALLRGVLGFSLGYLLYLLVQQAPNFQQRVVNQASWIFGATVLGSYLIHHFSLSVWWLTLPLPWLLLSVSKDGDTWLHRLLSCRALHLLGLISYSLYLIHPLIYRVARFVLNHVGAAHLPVNSWQNALFQLLVLVAVLVSSYLSYRWFELPLKRWLAPRRAR